MQHAVTTISGYVGAEPVVMGKQGSVPAVSIRVAYTPRYFQSSSNQWQHLPTVWLTVKAFKTLAVNIRQSVHKGDAIIATGTLAANEWIKDGQRHTQVVLEASAVGHDLSMGTTVFTKRGARYQSTDQSPVLSAGQSNQGLPNHSTNQERSRQGLPVDPYMEHGETPESLPNQEPLASQPAEQQGSKEPEAYGEFDEAAM